MRKSGIRASRLALLAFSGAFIITYTYGKRMTLLYGGLEIMIALACYWMFFTKFSRLDRVARILAIIVIQFAWVSGLFSGDLKSTLLITVPIIMPLCISTLRIVYKSSADFILVTVTAVVLTFLATTQNILAGFNSNSIGFLGFMGVSLGFLWVRSARFKAIPMGVVLIGILFAVLSGSRNVSIVGLACVGVLLLPDAILCNRRVYFLITIVIFFYTIFAANIMAWGFSVPAINDFLLDFTGRYSEKAWSLAMRVNFLRSVQSLIAQRNILQQLFGAGVCTVHGHNVFYQCVLEFGYLGTALLYMMFYRIFKQAYILIQKRNDQIALGCAVALWGNFLLQGADVYLIGPESYAIVPQVLMGIIMQRYSVYRYECTYLEQARLHTEEM